MFLKPPELPQDAAYTSHWCEENVYLLIQSFSRDSSLSEDWDVFAVFISNHSKTVALWNQKLSEELGCPVIWDYHVVAVLRSRNISTSVQSWVYDFDTRLGIPVTFDSKLKGAT
ncbi:N-terminal glutamine amidase-domain-containing protein [Lentinula lateritia]|uniref:Protein N-terminal glutamine amidohydrolase n=1 Tax=Lentinula lateritia TaxID=40482 RepID=A0ABQ8VLE5_9AGAR|nr:N-terminal glutamine amidase-domain-containing protein [Lentinula lateritia]